MWSSGGAGSEKDFGMIPKSFFVGENGGTQFAESGDCRRTERAMEHGRVRDSGVSEPADSAASGRSIAALVCQAASVRTGGSSVAGAGIAGAGHVRDLCRRSRRWRRIISCPSRRIPAGVGAGVSSVVSGGAGGERTGSMTAAK